MGASRRAWLFAIACALPVAPVAAQDFGGILRRAADQAQREAERRVGDAITGRQDRTGDGAQESGPPRRAPAPGASPASAPLADDSAAARDAALARLRTAPPTAVCDDPSKMSRVFGSACNSREFPAPPILSAPSKRWEVNPGWWGVWSPFLVGNLVLTGSCNNDGNEGISALDMATGRFVWRIASVCAEGNRRGSPGIVAFHELPSGEVLLIYPRDDGAPADHYVIDVKAGRIARTLAPAKRGPTRSQGALTVVNQSTKDGHSYISALSPDMARILWQNFDFRLAMTNNLDPRYKPTFAPPAAAGGVLFQTARSKDQPEPPTRQLHAIDLRSGRTLWQHMAQPVTDENATAAYRSDDGTPLVAGGKVIIPVRGLLGPVGIGRTPNGEGLRAIDPASGAILWTTAPMAGHAIGNRIATGGTLVVEAIGPAGRQLVGYRLSDAKPLWRRQVTDETRLLASSGGAFYLSERNAAKDYLVQGLDGATGTLLWTTTLPGHNLDFDGRWGIEDGRGGASQGPDWRIGRDGAIYGVTLRGAFKLQ